MLPKFDGLTYRINKNTITETKEGKSVVIETINALRNLKPLPKIKAIIPEININGKKAAMYEPVHGSAPDIAGQNKANPLAMIMSFAMMLKYSFDMIEDANLI